MDSIFVTFKSVHYYIMAALLALLIFTIGKFILNKREKIPFGKNEDKTTLLILILAHTQFLIGLFLLIAGPMGAYLSDMKSVMGNSDLRLMIVEHPLTMIIGVVLITMARIKMKKKSNDADKYKTVIIYYSIALFVFIIRIPWNHLNG